jgi:hypothetical protein
LCGHAFKVLDLMNIKTLPPQYILKRWTREARYEDIQDNHGRSIVENLKLDAMHPHSKISQFHRASSKFIRMLFVDR